MSTSLLLQRFEGSFTTGTGSAVNDDLLAVLLQQREDDSDAEEEAAAPTAQRESLDTIRHPDDSDEDSFVQESESQEAEDAVVQAQLRDADAVNSCQDHNKYMLSWNLITFDSEPASCT